LQFTVAAHHHPVLTAVLVALQAQPLAAADQ
jgi:hypothetical protein